MDQRKLGLNIDTLVHTVSHLLRFCKCRFPRQEENDKLFDSVHPEYCMITSAKVQCS